MSRPKSKASKALNALAITLVLALGLTLGLAIVAFAQGAVVQVPKVPATFNWTVSWNLTDDRLPFVPKADVVAEKTYEHLIKNIVPWYFTAGKTFTLVITNATPTTANETVSVEVTSTANETGGISWNVTITLPANYEPKNVYANWTIAVVLRNFGGADWIVFNVTTANMSLADLMGNLTKVSRDSYLPLPDGSRYYLFTNVIGAKTTDKDLYFRLPNLHFFYLFVGVTPIVGKTPAELEEERRLLAEVKLGTDVTVFGPTSYNETVSEASRDIYDKKSYTGFSPIYYVTCIYKGIEKGRVKTECKPIRIYLYMQYKDGRRILVYNYTSGLYKHNATVYGIATAYDFYDKTTVYLTAGINETCYRPALLAAIPAVEFKVVGVSDVAGNAIIEGGEEKLPILAEKLFAKWVLMTKPEATIVEEGPLAWYINRYAVVPIGTYVGIKGEAPKLERLKYAIHMYVFFKNVAVFVGNITISDVSKVQASYNITDVKVALVPVMVSITRYMENVTASGQRPLDPNFVRDIAAYYAYSIDRPVIAAVPPKEAVRGVLLFVESVEINGNKVSTTIAQFPPFVESSIYGIEVRPLVNWFVAPTINASVVLSDNTLVTPNYKNVTKSYYYTIWLMYGNVTVGIGVFRVGYNITVTDGKVESKVNVTEVIGAKEELKRFYEYGGRANVTTVVGINTATGTLIVKNISAARVFVAAAIVTYNVQFLTLCNETIKAGKVRVAELTPNGNVLVLAPVELSPAAPIIALTTPVGLAISEENGVPKIEVVKPKFNFTLNFFGYVMPSVDKDTRKPVYNYKLREGIVNVVYFPLVGVNFRVIANVKEKYPLMGFVVSVYSTVTGEEYWRAITNRTGMVYVMYVPINADYIKPRSDIRIVVRTIKPAEDSRYNYTRYTTRLEDYGQTYGRYKSALGLPEEAPAYTLGTRGPFDQGIVVLNKTMSIPFNTTCYYTFTLEVPVASLRIYVTDIEGNVLSSVPIYACAIPGKCPAVYYNVTLIIADGYSPYYNASEWGRSGYKNLTDFRIIGITWMRPVFKKIASEIKRLLDKTVNAWRSGKIDLDTYYKWYVGNYTFYLAASLLANYSTDTPYAIFTFPSVIPHEGTRFVRIFMPGQRFYVKVYYMGYEVFSQVVPVPEPSRIAIVTPVGEVKYVDKATVRVGGKEVEVEPGSIVIETAVKPVKFVVVSKNGAYRLDRGYLGLTFADAFFKVYAYEGKSLLTDSSVIAFVNKVIADVFESNITAADTLLVPNGTKMVFVNDEFVGKGVEYKPINARYSLAAYVLPDLMGFFVNASKPSIDVVPLYMTVINRTDGKVYFNVTLGINVTTTARGKTYTARPNATLFNTTYLALIYERTLRPHAIENITERPFKYVMSYNYTLDRNYTLWEAYVNATGMSRIDSAVIAVYARNNSGWFKVYEIDVTREFKNAMKRVIPVFVFVNYTAIDAKVKDASEIAIVVKVKGEGEKLELLGPNRTAEVPVLSTAFPGVTVEKNVIVYKTKDGKEVKATLRLPKANEAYFGSPYTIIVPIKGGEAIVEMPMWAPTTGAYGARIARVWIMASEETRNIGFGKVEVVRALEGLLPVYNVKSYVLLNYVEPKNGTIDVYVAIAKGVTVSGGYMPAVGAGTGGTSTLMLAYDVKYPVALFNVTLKTPSEVVLRTTALEGVKVRNVADFPVIVLGFRYVVDGREFDIGVKGVAVRPNATVTVPVEYIYGSAYNYTATWCDMGNFTPYIPELKVRVYYMPPNMTFYTADGTPLPFIVFGNGTVVIGEKRLSISDLEAPLESPVVPFRTIYAGANATRNITTVEITMFDRYGGSASWTVVGKVDDIDVASNDTLAVMVYNYTGKVVRALALEDWNGRPLPYQMIVSYGTASKPVLCAGAGALAISFTDASGELIQPIPAGERYVVYWYDSCLLNVIDKAYPYVNIYDSSINSDVETLGQIMAASAVKTHVVPVTIYLRTPSGEGIRGLLTVVLDAATRGMLFRAFNVTGTDGSITPIDLRIMPALSQMPPMSYEVIAYATPTGRPLSWSEVVNKTLRLVPVFHNRFSIQRTVMATALVQSYTLARLLGKATIVITTKGFGPAAGAVVGYTIEEPTVEVSVVPVRVGYRLVAKPALLPPPANVKYVAVTKKPMNVTTDEQGIATTIPFVMPVSPYAVRVTVTVSEWMGIPLGYTKTFYITSANATTPLVMEIPAVKLVVTPVSQAGGPLGKLATVNVTCEVAGREMTLASGSGEQTVIVPIPKAGSIRCTISGYSYGKSALMTKEFTMADAGKTISITLRIPVSGYYIPGVGFVPVSTLIMIAVLILIVIIIIVILLMEYWRRRGLRPPTGILGPR